MQKVTTQFSRRSCLKSMAAAAISLTSTRIMRAESLERQSRLTIALGEYSFNSDYRAGHYNPLNLAAETRKKFGLGAIDYVSSFWADKAKNAVFLHQLKSNAHDNGIVNHIILVDLPGPQLGDLDASRRKAAVEAHRPWLEIARFLGCSGIRVNLSGFDSNGFRTPGNKQAVLASSVEGYGRLLEYGAQDNLDVLVQNHMGYSCDPDWLVRVMQQVNNKHAGIEADPGHFQEIFLVGRPGETSKIVKGASFDLYSGWKKLMPYSKALNAKTHAFNTHGDETTMDYQKLLAITHKSSYTGYIGIEWEPEGPGRRMSPAEGIEATKALLRRYGASTS